VPAYMQPLAELQQGAAFEPVQGFGGFGALFPVYNPPPGFKLRLGGGRNDLFLSGTFVVGGKTVGLIRIPTMSPASPTTAVTQFATEIAYMDKNTDALILDVMRNGGGSL